MSEIQPPPIEEPRVERIPRTPERHPTPLDPRRRRIALAVAIAADVVQWVALPVFMWGGASPVNDVLDVIVALVMIRLIGFHWAFLPTFISKLIPFVDLAPTWTLAVWLATRSHKPSMPEAGR
jgi:hypothetical protein